MNNSIDYWETQHSATRRLWIVSGEVRDSFGSVLAIFFNSDVALKTLLDAGFKLSQLELKNAYTD